MIDYQQWGDQVKLWSAFKITEQRKSYQESSDAIHVFLNFKLIGKFKNKQEAQRAIDKLLKDSPVKLDDLQDYLIIP